jgi:phosphoheptose isomerase
MRRIAMISDHASPLADPGSVDSGGQNVYVAQVARHLARLDYLVDVFTRRDSEDLPEILRWEKGIRVIHVPAGPAEFVPKEQLLQYMGAFTKYMLAFFDREESLYDLIHAHFWMSGMMAADIKLATRIPFVVTFHALGRVRRLHQGEDDGFPKDRFKIEDRIVAEADRIIAECPQDRLDLINLYNADPARLAVIPCGFDSSELAPVDKTLSRKHLGIPAGQRVILQLGRMVPRKGIDTVVRGLAHLKDKHGIDANLIIVGGESDDPDPVITPEIARLQIIAEEKGVSDRVEFAGRRGRQEIKHYYSAADIFVSTPWYEPFGITPVEAMACGTPVIGSDVGGIKYTVKDGETGFLVPPDNPEALADRLAQVFQDPELLKKFSKRSLKRANEFFTWKIVAESIGDLYQEVLHEESVTLPAVLGTSNSVSAGTRANKESKRRDGSSHPMRDTSTMPGSTPGKSIRQNVERRNVDQKAQPVRSTRKIPDPRSNANRCSTAAPGGKVNGGRGAAQSPLSPGRRSKAISSNHRQKHTTKGTKADAIYVEAFMSLMETLQKSYHSLGSGLVEAAHNLMACISQGSKVMVCGNGGSAADAQHFAGEFVGRFKYPKRAALPVLSLTADTAFLTGWANDVGYEQIFSRQVQAFGSPGDVLFCISTSGCSENLVAACQAAQKQGIYTIALLGKDGGDLVNLVDTAIVVPSNNTQRVQEVQILLLHLITELVEEYLMSKESGEDSTLPTSLTIPAKAWDSSRSLQFQDSKKSN